MSTLVGEHAEPQAQDDRDVSLADTSTELGAEQAVAFFLQALERRWDAYVVSVTPREVALVAADARWLARRGRAVEPGALLSHSAELTALSSSARSLRARLSTQEGADIVVRMLRLDGRPMPPVAVPSADSVLELTREAATNVEQEPEPEPAPEPEPVAYWPAPRPRQGGRLRLGGTGLTAVDDAVKFEPPDQSREHAVVSVEGWDGQQQQHPGLTVAYFEATVVEQGERFVGVGVVPADYPRHRQPGWEKGSWGYHGDDGKLYEQQPAEDKAKKKGETFGTGDVVGCGWVCGPHATRLFWTKNGKLIPELRVILQETSASAVQLRPAVGLGVGGAARFNLGADPGTFSFDLRTGLLREPSSLGDTCVLAQAAKDVADAAAGPLQENVQGTVDAIDHVSDSCLVSGWWYEHRALVCPLDLQVKLAVCRHLEVELEREHSLLRAGVGVSESAHRLTAPSQGVGVLATSVSSVRASERKTINWTLRLKDSSPNQRFALGAIEDTQTLQTDSEPNLKLFSSGWGVKTAEVLGAPRMCQLMLPSKAEELRKTEICIAAGAGQLSISTQKRGGNGDASIDTGTGAGSGQQILTASLASSQDAVLRLGVVAYAGCELELVSPVTADSDCIDITIVCPQSQTYELLPAMLMLAHAGVPYEFVTQDVTAACLTDRSRDPCLRLRHPQTMVSYIARRNELYPASLDATCQVDEVLATVHRCWKQIHLLIEAQGVDGYIERAVDDSRQWMQGLEHAVTRTQPKSDEDTGTLAHLSGGCWALSEVASLVKSSSMRSGRTAADFAVAVLTSFHLRLCPAVAAVYTPLVGHFRRFRRACCEAELKLLTSVQVGSTEQWLAEKCDTMASQGFQQIREDFVGHPMLAIVDPAELADSQRSEYTALLAQACVDALQLEHGHQDSGEYATAQLVAHRLASLFSIPLTAEKRGSAASLAYWAVKEAESHDGCDARDACEWYLEAFDLYRVAAGENQSSDEASGEIQQARQCLLNARVRHLQAVSATSASLSQKFSSPSHHAALMYDPTFSGIETQAWGLAFPEACCTVHSVLTDIVLELASSRHGLLEHERERVAQLQARVSLTKTSSGSLFRFSETSGEPEQRVSVRVNVSQSRPQHVLSTSASPLNPVAPRQRLSTVLMGSRCGQVLLAVNSCKEPGDKPTERKVKQSVRNGGPAYLLLKVVQQTNNDACGYHTFFNVITVCRALSSPDLTSAQSWLQDLQATRAFEQEMSALQLALRQEARRRQADPASQSWEVASILERSHAVWLLQTTNQIATLGGETVFSVIEFVEGDVKSFDLSETIDFHTNVLQEFADASEDVAMMKAVMIGTTAGKETGHWVGFVASRLPGVAPEFALLDSQNKVSNKSVGHAADLLVRCFQGKASLLQSVLQHRLAPLVAAVQDAAGQGDTHLAKLRAIKPASAWRQDELESLELLAAAGANVEVVQAGKLRDGIHSLLRSLDWAAISASAPAERESIAEMARLLVAVGGEVNCEPDALQLPDAAKPRPDKALVQQLCDMGFSVFAAQRGALAVSNRSAEAALSWLVERAGDTAIDEPIDDS